MSRVVEAMPVPAGQKYDWERWADGRVHELKRGEDFDCAPQRVRQTAWAFANRKGFRVETAVRGDSVFLRFWMPTWRAQRGEAAE